MLGVLKRIFSFLNKDLRGKTREREMNHPYFGQMIYFGFKDSSKCYWEAELFLPDLAKKIGITMMGTPNGPEPSEESFCRSVLTDLDGLFEKCREAFEKEFPTWTKKPFPSKWRNTFMLDGFSVPPHGNPGAAWDVCYFVEPANCYFTARFEAGRVQQVIVDT